MKKLLGEFIGTLVLVLIGCGTVAVAVLFGVLNLYGVALFFGAGVTVAIYVSRGMCPAHLNPAVSFAFMLSTALSVRNFGLFVVAQMLGAFAGGMILFAIFNPFIIDYEAANSIVRGTTESYHSAVMFGEFFPNPGFENELEVSHLAAIFFEALGTFLLMTMIFNVQKIESVLKVPAPVLIGMTVTVLIILIAPYTQGGFNPARDFGPRLMAYFGGWGNAAFPAESFSFFTVYILGPMAGGALAARLVRVR